jgi:hypothetical protein
MFMFDLTLSWWLNTIKSSHATSHVRMELYYNVSEPHYVSIISEWSSEKILSYVHVDGVRLRLSTAATKGPIPQMIMSVWRATVEWYWQEKPKKLVENPVPIPLFPPQISHGLKWASVVRGLQLRAWAMAWPYFKMIQSVQFTWKCSFKTSLSLLFVTYHFMLNVMVYLTFGVCIGCMKS